MNNCKYYKQKKYISYDCQNCDDCQSWEETSDVRKGDLYQSSSTDCGFSPTPAGSGDYLTFVALEDGQFTYLSESSYNAAPNQHRNPISYSYDGLTWTTPSSSFTINVYEGERVLWKGDCYTPDINIYTNGIGYFSSTIPFNVEGNIFSLLYNDDFRNKTSINNGLGQNSCAFKKMFSGSSVVNAENLVLPASGVTEHCYHNMFADCTSLVSAPELPAITAEGTAYSQTPDGRYAYCGMFSGCTSLVNAPSTISLDKFYYFSHSQMFAGCTSLEAAPEILTSGDAASHCCYAMFNCCTSLTDVPSMNIGKTSEYCFAGMFNNCKSLSATPEINYIESSSGGDYNYSFMSMFEGCTSLREVLIKIPRIMSQSTCDSMFAGCTSLTSSPLLPAQNLGQYCYQAMFYGCTNLSEITCLATSISAQGCTNLWVVGVAPRGNFIKYPYMSSWQVNQNGIPSGWTITDYEFDGKWVATYSGGTILKADCDSTSAITQMEISSSKLLYVKRGDCVTSIGDYAFYSDSSLTGCTIGNNVISIGQEVFRSCSGLTSVDIPDSVTSIGKQAFYQCYDLRNVTIGSGITNISQSAFESCTGLTSITVEATTPPTLGSNAFDWTDDCPIYVPSASVNTYKAASGWSTYASRIQAIT